MGKQQEFQEENPHKRTLRDQPKGKAKKIIELDQDQEDKLIEDKSKRYWKRVNRKYFPVLTLEQVLQKKRDLQEKQLNLPQKQTKQKITSYFTANIFSKEPRLFDKKGIKVLFKKESQAEENKLDQQYFAINYIFNLSEQEILKNFKAQILAEKSLPFQQQSLSIKCLNLFNNQIENIPIFQQKQMGEIGLSMNKVTSNLKFITDILNYQVNRLIPNGQNETENQIMLWEQQHQRINNENSQIWDKMVSKFKMIQSQEDQDFISKQIRQGSDLQAMMNQMFKFLSWKDVLLNFKKGYSDKTQDMLAQALEIMYIKQNMKNMGAQKKLRRHNQKVLMNVAQLQGLFETDCKICFSTYSSQKNRVVYCDLCNDSFHQGCYGIQDIDKKDQFICDSCLYLKICGNNKTVHKLKITCSICYVPFFSTKNVDGNFYHPACLFLNNLIQHQSGTIRLKDHYQHKKILEKVSDNQIQMGPCQFCMETAHRGLRVRCSAQGCMKCYHHLCAYLNAAVFDIWRHDKFLQVKVSCHEHYENRDFYRQAYLRRFFCNFNNTSSLNQDEFIEIYNQQLAQIKQFKLSSNPLGLIKMSKIIQDYKQNHLKKKMREKQQKKKHKHKEYKQKHRHESKQKDNKLFVSSEEIEPQNKFSTLNLDINQKSSQGQLLPNENMTKKSISQNKSSNLQINGNLIEEKKRIQKHKHEYKQTHSSQKFTFIIKKHKIESKFKQIEKKKKQKEQDSQKEYKIRSSISLVSSTSYQSTKTLRSSKKNLFFPTKDIIQKQRDQRGQVMDKYFDQTNLNACLNLDHNKNMFIFHIQQQENQNTTHLKEYQIVQKNSDYSVVEMETIQSQCQKKITSCQNYTH